MKVRYPEGLLGEKQLKFKYLLRIIAIFNDKGFWEWKAWFFGRYIAERESDYIGAKSSKFRH